jgi:hypothetical protein
MVPMCVWLPQIGVRRLLHSTNAAVMLGASCLYASNIVHREEESAAGLQRIVGMMLLADNDPQRAGCWLR